MEILRDPVIFLPVRNGRVPQILDFATLSSSGVYVGNYLGQTVDQVRADYPDAQLGECDDVIATKEAMLKVLEKANLDAANPVRKDALQRTCGLTL